jgi:hypothetical protein
MRLRPSSRDSLRRLVAGGCAALILALTILAVCPSLHAWLHGEKQLDPDDGCAVVLLVQGVTPALAAIGALLVAFRVLRERLPAPRRLFLAAIPFQFPPGCGPPAS